MRERMVNLVSDEEFCGFDLLSWAGQRIANQRQHTLCCRFR